MDNEEFEIILDELCSWTNTIKNRPKHNKTDLAGFPVVEDVKPAVCQYCGDIPNKNPILSIKRTDTGWVGNCSPCKKKIKLGDQ